jgi:hypothetical protein
LKPSLRGRRVGKGALAPCPPSIHIVVEWWARFALPILRSFPVIASHRVARMRAR